MIYLSPITLNLKTYLRHISGNMTAEQSKFKSLKNSLLYEAIFVPNLRFVSLFFIFFERETPRSNEKLSLSNEKLSRSNEILSRSYEKLSRSNEKLSCSHEKSISF